MWTQDLGGISGVVGAYTEYLQKFHRVAMRVSGARAARRLVLRMPGNGEFDIVYELRGSTVCARDITTREN
jgi:TPP-dependent 2-oxoacid decarboxylase